MASLGGHTRCALSVVLCAHPIRGESHIQHNTNREVATLGRAPRLGRQSDPRHALTFDSTKKVEEMPFVPGAANSTEKKHIIPYVTSPSICLKKC